MFKELFQHISDQIETVKDTNDQSVIRWVDFDLGQMDEENPPVSFPCALITFGDVGDFTTFTDGSQQGAMTITVRLAFKLRERTNSKTPPPYRNEALEMLNIVEAVHTALQATYGDDFGQLERSALRSERKSAYRVFEMDYSTVIFTSSPTWKANGGPFVPWEQLAGSPALPAFCLHPNVE